MFRAAISSINSSTVKSSYNVSGSFVCVQCVRWRRKPRWMQTAKSKLFRVPERKKQPEDERLELLKLHNIYKTQMRSIRSYFREESTRVKATSSADHLIVTPEEEEAELQRAIDENNKWNSNIAELRAVRLSKESEERKILINQRLDAKVLRDEESLENVEELVRLEKERSKTFITKDNLDKAIEFALANPIDLNFAIDLQQNIFSGRNTPAISNTTPIKKEETSSDNNI